MKPHYPILDGLRGTAAILVASYHLFEAYYPVPANHPIHHSYLALDFFYLLSGFVVSYSYDDCWSTMSVRDFFKIRLMLLHPLIILGVFTDAMGFWLEPYTNGMQHVQGLGFSETSKCYTIKDIDETVHYSTHPVLGSRLINICNELFKLEDNNANRIFGSPDDLKLKS